MDQNKRNENGQTFNEFLSAYSPKEYDRPSVTLDIVIFTPEYELLLIQRKNHPNIGCWALPGGFLEMDESLYQGAMRELKEETGVTQIEIAPVGMFGGVDRDPRTRIITMAFSALVPRQELHFKAADDAADAKLFHIDIQALGKVGIPVIQNRYPDISLPCTSFGEPTESEGMGYVISLTSEQGDTLSATVANANNSNVLLMTPAYTEDERVAGDHALIIFTAIQQVFPEIFDHKNYL